MKNFNKLKRYIYLISPRFVKDIYEKLSFQLKLRSVRQNHLRELRRLRDKKSIKVVFLLIHESIWKYEGLYRLMDQDERFEPVVVVCPYTKYGDDNMFREMNQSYNSFIAKGYNVIKSFDEKNNWINIKEDINPDIVCFTNPWNLTREEYRIENFLDHLTCYVPYGFKCSHLNEAHYNKPMQNFVWKFFIETNIHKKLSKKYSRNNGRNSVVTGYPGMDKLLEEIEIDNDPWKIKAPKIKRIIWAPHHSIPGHGANLDYSTFMDYHQSMLNLAKKLKNEIQIAFKPHPILRSKLSRPDIWGSNKTDAYYDTWKNLENGMLVEGDYIDLFKSSNALIHDGASFLVDYLFTGNPTLYLIRDSQLRKRFNLPGQLAFDVHYHASNIDDIYNFINSVLKSEDQMGEERNAFYESVVKPPNNKTASENIYEEIVNELKT